MSLVSYAIGILLSLYLLSGTPRMPYTYTQPKYYLICVLNQLTNNCIHDLLNSQNGVFWHWYHLIETPRMRPTYTTTNIFLKFSDHIQRPNNFIYALKNICVWYLLLWIDIFCPEHRECHIITPQPKCASRFLFSTNVPTTSLMFYAVYVFGIVWRWYLLVLVSLVARYLHHNQNTCRIFCPQPTSQQLHACRIGYLLLNFSVILIFYTMDNFCHW